MNKKIFLILLMLIFMGGVMQIGAGGVYGQQPQNWPQKPDLLAQVQSKKSLPPYQLRLGQKPNLDNLEYWSDLRSDTLKRYELTEKFQKMNLKDKYDVLITCTFDSQTLWPPKDKMPPNFDPKKILEIRKDPGLSIRELHKQGITGKGVKVAIIDQALPGHKEYDGKVAKCTEVGYTEEEIKNGLVEKTSMHGPAVTSILVGNECGVAPGASLYYWVTMPRWSKTEAEIIDNYIADKIKAIRLIIKYNENNPKDPIKVVSISRGFGGNVKNREEWNKVKKEIKQNGIIVITTDSDFGCAQCSMDKNKNEPNNYDLCCFMQSREEKPFYKGVYVPIDNRTYAGMDGKSYTSEGDGGASWGAPYLAGVMALGFQVDPNLKEDDIWKYLQETGTPFIKKIDGKEYDFGWIINPKGFVDRVKLELENRVNKTK